MAETIFSTPLFAEIILPFLLVFVVVFAILQKSKVLGDGKKQIDALVALVVGLIFIGFAYATGIVVTLVPFMVVSAIIILIFLMLYGMVFVKGDFDLDKNVKYAIGAIIAAAVIVAVLVATGAWDYLKDQVLYGESGGAVATNAAFIIIILIAIGFVWWGGGKASGGK